MWLVSEEQGPELQLSTCPFQALGGDSSKTFPAPSQPGHTTMAEVTERMLTTQYCRATASWGAAT